MGQVPMAAAQDKLFPPIVRPAVGARRAGDRNRDLGALGNSAHPGPGDRVGGFSAFYNLVVGLSTMAAVIPYAFCALAASLVARVLAAGRAFPGSLSRDRGIRIRHVHALWLRR